MKICFVLFFICMMLTISGVSAETITMEDAGQDVNETVQKEWVGATNYVTFNVSSISLHSGQILELNDGYNLTLAGIDGDEVWTVGSYSIEGESGGGTPIPSGVYGDRALINIEKNGVLLDQHIVSSDGQYYYNRSFNETDKIIISAYISAVYQGQTSSLIIIESIKQYSDVGTVDTNPTKLLKVGDTWDLENNYSLNFAEVENDGTYCVLFLYENGSTVDKRIIEDNSVYEYQRRNESINDTETILEISVLNTLSLTFGGYAEFISNYSIKSDAGTVDINPFVLVRSGESWELNDGYNVTVDETSSNRRALVTLKKENIIVDRDIIEEDSTYYYNRLNLSDNTTHLILDINSSKIFNGIYNDYVQFYSEYIMYSDAGTVDIDEKIIISEGDTFELDQGYNLTLLSTDIDGNKIYIKLTKNGQSIDERILETGEHYFFNRSVYGKDQVIISFVLNNVFSTEVNRLAILKDFVQNPDIYADDDDIPIKKDVVEIRSPFFNGTGLEAMATAAGGSLSIDYSNFAGFYYDLDGGVGSEAITINNGIDNVSATRTIETGGLIYTTDIQDVPYEFEDWNDASVFTLYETTYEKVGFLTEEYVPIYYKPEKLSKLITDSDEKYTIRTGQSLDIGNGFALTAQQVDVEGDKVWLELTKDGEFVDDEVLTVSGTGVVNAKTRTWEYDTDIAGETDVVLMRVHVKEVFQGQVDSFAVIKGIWLISDDIKTIESDDTFGKLEVTDLGMGADGVGLTLKNENSITLTKDTVIDLSDGMKIKVADSNDVRFYFMKEITEPGTYEVRGSVVNSSAVSNFIWDETSFAGFYYDIDDNVASESLNITTSGANDRTIAEGALIYTTTIQQVSYEYEEWSAWNEKYDKIGLFAAEYVPIKGKAEKLSKLITDTDEKYTIGIGQSLDIGGGFALVVQEVDVEGGKVLLELTKDGEFVSDEVVDVTGAAVNSSWDYDADVGGETDVVLMRVHVKELFQGQVDSLAVIEGIWLISDDIMEIKSDDEFGKLDKVILGGNYLEMSNDNSITLTNDFVIELAEDMKLRVADSGYGDVRYFPFVEVKVGIEIKSLYINYFSPVAPVLTSYVGMDQEFRVNTNEICNFTWLINGNEIQINHSALSASYVNNTANPGFYNVTVVAETSDEVVQHTWNWTVTESLSIDYFSPADPDHTSYMGVDQEFKANTSKICNFTWLINGNEIQNNNSALSASYVNNTANVGFYNVTVVAETLDEVVQHTWNWTVTEPLSIDYFTPLDSDLTSYMGVDQEFKANTNKICNFTWLINGNEIQNNNSALSASYVNNTANPGFYNVTVVAETSDEVVQHTWNWTVIEPLSIDYFSPLDSDLTSYMGVDQEFKANTSKICNFTWFINGNEIQNNNSALSTSYVNNTANVGFYNVKVVAETSDEVVQHTWNWTVIVTPPTISIPTTGEIFYLPQNTTFVNGTTIGTNVSVYVNGALVHESYPVTEGMFNISGVPLVDGTNMINVTATYNDAVIEHFSENTSVTVSVGQILDVTTDTIMLDVPGLPSGIELPFIDLNITGQGNNMPTNISSSVVAAVSAPPASNMTGPAIDLSVPGNDSYTFDHPISLTLGFNASSVVDFNKTVVAWYNESSGTWVSLKSTVNATANTTTANVTHFTVFVPIEDNTPPAITALASTEQTASFITLSWANSYDTNYIDIWRDNAYLANVSTTSYTDSGLLSSTSYTYALRPVDIVGNKGNWTNVTVSTTSPTSNGGGSSGGDSGSSGGGSGSSGEDYYNILKKEVKREYVNANSEIIYEFEEETNVIDYIKFTSLKNSGTIAATIEVLKDTSSLVETKPSGGVYQNMNIWVGTSGFATPQNIENLVIEFKVERSWIVDNDIVASSIRLCRHYNDSWDNLVTREIGDDEKYIYFEADTPGFSPFVIIGYTEEEMTTQEMDEPTSVPGSSRMSPPSDIAPEVDVNDEVPVSEAYKVPGLGISVLMLLIGCAYLTMRRLKLP